MVRAQYAEALRLTAISGLPQDIERRLGRRPHLGRERMEAVPAIEKHALRAFEDDRAFLTQNPFGDIA